MRRGGDRGAVVGDIDGVFPFEELAIGAYDGSRRREPWRAIFGFSAEQLGVARCPWKMDGAVDEAGSVSRDFAGSETDLPLVKNRCDDFR